MSVQHVQKEKQNYLEVTKKKIIIIWSSFMIAHTIMNIRKCALSVVCKAANLLKCFHFYKVTKFYKKKKELKQLTER